MENNSLAIIQQKYKDCNLLLPMTTSAQINPFYRLDVMEVKADLSDNSGDIFKVGSVKVGNSWVETFSPAKPLLMKLASAAGIQFDPNNTYGTLVSKNCYKAKAYGAMRLPDGTGKTHCDEKIINLEDEEDRFRLEFMDKSIEGILDERAAQEAAKMFKGTWFDTTNKWGKTVKAYKIADEDRQTYIDRSAMVNMSLLRKTAAEKAMTGAILRVIRALIGMKGQYTKNELAKPFAVPRVTFSPDYNDPTVRNAMLEQGLNSVSNMFDSRPMLANPVQEADYTASDGMYNTDEFVGNPAFILDNPDNNPDFAEEQNEETPPPPPTRATNDSPTVPTQNVPTSGEPSDCNKCGKTISSGVLKFSVEKFGLPLCMKCQPKEDDQA